MNPGSPMPKFASLGEERLRQLAVFLEASKGARQYDEQRAQSRGMHVFLGITGASGAPYAARLLEALAAADCEIGVCGVERRRSR